MNQAGELAERPGEAAICVEALVGDHHGEGRIAGRGSSLWGGDEVLFQALHHVVTLARDGVEVAPDHPPLAVHDGTHGVHDREYCYLCGSDLTEGRALARAFAFVGGP